MDNVPPRGSETLILAEDYSGLREATRVVLESHGYTVIEAVDGQDAVDKFTRDPEAVGMVILDIVMPNKGGIKAYEEMAAIRPGLRALFTSGHAEEEIQEGKSGAGLEFISKPSPPAELLRRVRTILDRRA